MPHQPDVLPPDNRLDTIPPVVDEFLQILDDEANYPVLLHCKAGLHRTYVGSVERGERNLSILNLRLIARILRVPLSDLLVEVPTTGRPL